MVNARFHKIHKNNLINTAHKNISDATDMLAIGLSSLEKKLDENQPREQAGFRSKYSTTDTYMP